jgi:thiol-disulfide isomerase/thioredoxin
VVSGQWGAVRSDVTAGKTMAGAKILNPKTIRNASYRKTVHEEVDLKQRFGSLGLGITILGLVFGFAAFVSSDVRLMYVIGAVLLFGSAMWMGTKSEGGWLTTALLSTPLIAAFWYLVLPQIPVLWPHLLLWVIAAAIGLHALDTARSHRILAIGAAGVLLATSLWYCMRYVPEQVARSLSQFRDTSAPTFTLQPVSDGKVPTGPMTGAVLIIDFFSTTCGPCIAELPELARVREDLQDRGDIQFVVVASEAGGDTPQHFRSFAQQRRITMPLAYDSGGRAHKAFGFTGVPALVVLDRTGRVRFTHQGYNASETNFRRDLVQFLKTL